MNIGSGLYLLYGYTGCPTSRSRFNSLRLGIDCNSFSVISMGKIGDIFNEQGISESFHDKGNEACIDRLVECLTRPELKPEFLFVNLVDSDMLYGHRRDIKGYH